MTNKKEIVLDILTKIADLNFQKEVWINQEYWDMVLNFDEAVNLLDDYCFFDEIEKGKIMFTDDKGQKTLKLFAKELLSYEEPSDIVRMQEDEKWRKISLNAGEISEKLKLIEF